MADQKLGPTGNFPRGKVSDDDAGELAIGVGIDVPNGIVVVNFGTPVQWLGFSPTQSREIADMLIAKAAELESKLS